LDVQNLPLTHADAGMAALMTLVAVYYDEGIASDLDGR
jgi:hypothetical protein